MKPTLRGSRAAIYTRVSSDPSGRARSVGEQEADCRADADREGWDVIEPVFTDNDRSASRYARKARPGFDAVLKLIESGGCDVLIIWEASRSQRELGVYVELRNACAKSGVLLSYNGKVYDMTDGDDRRDTARDAIDAEYESERTSKRVLRAVRSTAIAGKPHGRHLYGYHRKYERLPNGKQELIEIVPDENAEIVKETARRVLAGETTYAIAKDFNRRGLPSPRSAPGGWNPEQVKRLCTNASYAGLRTHKGVVITTTREDQAAMWPALITEADYRTLSRKLNDPARRTQRESKISHFLSGIVECGFVDRPELEEDDPARYCGGRMRVQRNRDRKSYMCVDKFHLARREDLVDEFVEGVLIEYLTALDLSTFNIGGDEEAQAAIDEVAILRARLDDFYESAANGETSPAALARIEARILGEIATVERRITSTTRSPLLEAVAGPDAESAWQVLVMPQRRELVRLLMDIRILKAGVGNKVFNPDLIQVYRLGRA